MSIRVNKNTAKLAFKGLGRQVEKMKLGFGMVEQTKDDNLAILVNKYFQHQQGSTKFLKSLRDYFECQKNLYSAHLQMQTSLLEFYDLDWINREEMLENFTHFSLLYEHFITQISDRIIDPFTQYLSRFPYYKDKLDKRGRKLLDYDSCKREVENLQSKILRNKDGKDPRLLVKLTSLEDEFQNAKDQYDKITDELYEDLTILNNNRVVFSAKILEYFFQAQESLHKEVWNLSSSSLLYSSKLHEKGNDHIYDIEVSRNLSDCIVEKISAIIAEESYTDISTPPRPRSSTLEKGGVFLVNPMKRKTVKQTQSASLELNIDYHLDKQRTDFDNSDLQLDSSLISNTTSDDDNSSLPFEHSSFFLENMVIVPTSPVLENICSHKHSLDSNINSLDTSKPKKPKRPQTFYFDDSFRIDSETLKKLSDGFCQGFRDTNFLEEDQALIQLRRLKRQRTLSVHDNLPNILYSVRALFDYISENSDELTFKKGDIISVILDSSTEMDEGWLMGKHESTRLKGIFPANHTTLI